MQRGENCSFEHILPPIWQGHVRARWQSRQKSRQLPCRGQASREEPNHRLNAPLSVHRYFRGSHAETPESANRTSGPLRRRCEPASAQLHGLSCHSSQHEPATGSFARKAVLGCAEIINQCEQNPPTRGAFSSPSRKTPHAVSVRLIRTGRLLNGNCHVIEV